MVMNRTVYYFYYFSAHDGKSGGFRSYSPTVARQVYRMYRKLGCSDLNGIYKLTAKGETKIRP